MNVDLMHGPIFKSLVVFMLPIFVSNLFQQLYNTVDTMIVGNVLGDTALAAIGSCGSIYELLVGFGLGIGIHTALIGGACCILVPKFNVNTYAELLIKKQPNIIPGVPTLFEALLRAEKLENADLSCLKGVFSGGDSMSIELKKKVDDFLKAHNASVQVRQGYGLTECVTASCLTPKDYNRVGSIGVPFPDTYYKIVKPGTTQELDANLEGEICVSGPSVMLEYVDNPEETHNTLRRHEDGRIWLHTGDLGKMDEDGFVYFSQRIKRMIIRHDGFKVFPSMIENVISRHPAVHQCCVVGCADTDHTQGRLPFVFVVLEPAATGKKRQILRELRQLCLEELPEYVQPAASAYKIIPEMPLTPAGKADYRKLEEEAG